MHTLRRLSVLLFDMFLQLVLPLERSGAQMARKRCLPSVSPHMDFQVALLDKRELAHTALEGLLSCVGPDVSNKTAAPPRCVWAVGAPVPVFVLTLPRVGLLISHSVVQHWVVSLVRFYDGRRLICALDRSPPDC